MYFSCSCSFSPSASSVVIYIAIYRFVQRHSSHSYSHVNTECSCNCRWRSKSYLNSINEWEVDFQREMLRFLAIAQETEDKGVSSPCVCTFNWEEHFTTTFPLTKLYLLNQMWSVRSSMRKRFKHKWDAVERDETKRTIARESIPGRMASRLAFSDYNNLKIFIFHSSHYVCTHQHSPLDCMVQRSARFATNCILLFFNIIFYQLGNVALFSEWVNRVWTTNSELWRERCCTWRMSSFFHDVVHYKVINGFVWFTVEALTTNSTSFHSASFSVYREDNEIPDMKVYFELNSTRAATAHVRNWKGKKLTTKSISHTIFRWIYGEEKESWNRKEFRLKPWTDQELCEIE